MRKRRRLTNKMTIMVCAVLIAVSTFFYAPMEVSAEEVVSLSTATDITSTSLQRYVCENKGTPDSKSFDFSSYLDGDGLYKITFNFSANYYCLSELNHYPVWLNVFTCINTSDSFYQMSSSSPNWQREFNYSINNFTIYLNSDSPVVRIIYFFVAVFKYNVAPTVDFSMNYSISDIVVTKVLDEDSEEYQNGYNAGYYAGEQAGYSNGYSQGFTDGEASVDTDAIYDEAFQAGKDSVDTQSYYDAGYQAGYQVAYSEGYESGYDVGYQSAMDRIANWGADTSDYPKLLTTKTMSKWGIPSEVQVGVVQDIHATLGVDLGVSVDPNHTYMFDVAVTDYNVTGSSIDPPANHDLFFYVGSNKYYLISQNETSCNQTLYVPGSIMSDVFGFSGDAYNVHVLESQTTDQVLYTYLAYTVKMYDMGPSGDTQNHIANQTDKLNENADKNTDKILNSWDSSKGNTVNSNLSTGLNEYETAENSLFATATTGMRDFTFFDFESVPAMITGLSFISSIMSSWFNQAGGASGVGIVLSILFSVILVAMVLGLYRWYQSRGGKN